METHRPAHDPHTLVVTLAGRIDRADVARLGALVEERISGERPALVVCDVGHLVEPDAAAVDAICRMRVASRRVGSRLELRNAAPALLELLDLMGLCGVLPATPRSELEAQG